MQPAAIRLGAAHVNKLTFKKQNKMKTKKSNWLEAVMLGSLMLANNHLEEITLLQRYYDLCVRENDQRGMKDFARAISEHEQAWAKYKSMYRKADKMYLAELKAKFNF